ncbi:MAG: DUF2099 family protein [Nanoarchaeota archaeon]|nr:DUF2099 family protein [Nanoarchaeota archaeon]
MELDRVVSEIEDTGVYWRGDSSVEYIEGQAVLSLRIKNGDPISQMIPGLPDDVVDQIKYPTPTQVADSTSFQTEVLPRRIKVFNNGGSIREAVAPLVEIANSVQYPEIHITRRAGSYILILDQKAIYATESLIEYCPLAKALFTRHDYEDDTGLQDRILRELNEQAIGEFKMFGPNRRLQECEAKVPFGSSEIMMNAMEQGYFEVGIQVCDGVGTVITTSPQSSQGVGAVMTGTFFTTPIRDLVRRCYEEGVYPVCPETADIDQVEGVRSAILLGHNKIAVTTAAEANRDLGKISELEMEGIEIYKFALCSTGIEKETAEVMAEHADLAWTCASKHAREVIAPSALIQVGLKIPAYVMTQRGWELVKSRLLAIDPEFKETLDSLPLDPENRHFIAHISGGRLTAKPVSAIREGVDIPRPLV